MGTITITKKAALLVGLAFLATVSAVAAGSVAWASNRFSDVPDDHIFHNDVDWVAGAGIVNGFADGTYKPGNNVTRGQLAAFIHRASGNASGIAPSFNAAKLGGKTAAQWQAESDTQQDEIDALEDKLQFVSIVGANTIPTMRISGANLQVVNGTNSKEFINGLGNLIVGYNAQIERGVVRTGSHNIIVGDEHDYTSYGGLVAGYWNTISGPYASVTGGVLNTASMGYANVTGGYSNNASGMFSVVSGGKFRSSTAESEWRAGDLYNDPDG